MTNLEDFNYSLFHPQNTFDESSLTISDQAYNFWQSFWNQVFKDNQTDSITKEDTYIKQDIIAAITYKGEIVALHLYTFYNLNSSICANNPYLKIIPTEKFKKFENNGLKTGMAMEYLSVNKEFRKSKIGFSLGDVLIGLGLNLVRYLNVDCVFGITRDDRGVDKISEKFGGQSFHSGFNLHNTPCSFSVISSKTCLQNPDPFVANFIQNLWKKRTSYLNYKQTSTTERIAS